jgi:hypothetical protein
VGVVTNENSHGPTLATRAAPAHRVGTAFQAPKILIFGAGRQPACIPAGLARCGYEPACRLGS